MVPPEADNRSRKQAPKSRWDFEGRYFETSLPNERYLGIISIFCPSFILTIAFL